MPKVLECQPTSGHVYVEKDFVSPLTTWWVQFDFWIPTTTFTALGAALGHITPDLLLVADASDGFLISASSTGSGDFTASPPYYYATQGAPTPYAGGFSAGAWHTAKAHWDGATITWWADGSEIYSYALASADLDNLRLGATDSFLSGTTYYFDNLKVGTAEGLGDVFCADFESGSLADFDDTAGPPTIIDDPLGTGGPSGGCTTPPPPVSSGVIIAFTDEALAPSPTFTRIDDVTGLNTASIRIKRGRPDERSKTSVGTAEISGFDMVGYTDPTNATGPWYGNLDPMKQAAVNLYNPTTSEWGPIYTGYTSVWTHVLDVSEQKLDFTLDLVDMLDLLNSAEIVPDQTGNTVPGESKGDVFYEGARVDDRLYAVLADAATALLAQTWPPALLRINSGNVFVQRRIYANRTTLLQVVDEACDAEGPGVTNRFVDVAGVFNFIGRYPRYVPDSDTAGSGNAGTARFYPGGRLLHWYVGDVPASLVDDTLAVYTGLEYTRDGTNLINASLVTPLGIADADIAAQFVYDTTSVGQYGPRTEGTSYENIITGDAVDGNTPYQETKSYGQATVDNYKDPVDRVSKLTFRNPPAGASSARAFATWQLLCNIELSDWVTVTSTHPGGGGFDAVDHFVEGITYQINPLRGDEWDITLTLDLSPRAYYATMPASWDPPVPGALSASFSANPQTGVAPLAVAFTDTSTPGPSGPIVSWAWDFGDGGTSTSENPSYTFNDPGTWKVVLTVTGTGGDGTSAFTRYIHAVA